VSKTELSDPTTTTVVVDGQDVELRRSARRKRTVSAYHKNGRLVVLLPAGMAPKQEEDWARLMLARANRRRTPCSDAELMSRAQELSDKYLGGRAKPKSVRWVTNQQNRWGSCTPLDATIRISDRVAPMPGFVRDYVLLHELNHLLHFDHDEAFWAELASFPHLARARGYLEGVDFGKRMSNE